MKKSTFILMVIAALFIAITATAQPRPFNHMMHFKDVYKTIDTLVLKNAPVPATIDMNDTYLIELPHESKIVVAYNDDKTKAIILRNGYLFGKHFEFDVKDDEKRTVFYHNDDALFCGYIYDKASNAAQYFETINDAEKNNLIRRMPFLRRFHRFNRPRE